MDCLDAKWRWRDGWEHGNAASATLCYSLRESGTVNCEKLKCIKALLSVHSDRQPFAWKPVCCNKTGNKNCLFLFIRLYKKAKGVGFGVIKSYPKVNTDFVKLRAPPFCAVLRGASFDLCPLCPSINRSPEWMIYPIFHLCGQFIQFRQFQQYTYAEKRTVLKSSIKTFCKPN